MLFNPRLRIPPGGGGYTEVRDPREPSEPSPGGPPWVPPTPGEPETPPQPTPPMGDTTEEPSGGFGGFELPPEPLPPPPDNSPLALPQSFAQPGTPQAVPFRTPAYAQGRFTGPSGPGVQVFGGIPGFSGIDEGQGDDELMRRILSGLRAAR
jgi:hypothetical protein